MTHQMNGQQLQKALEMLAEVVSPLKKEETVLERPSDGDLLYYDNVSMMEKLKFLNELCNATAKWQN